MTSPLNAATAARRAALALGLAALLALPACKERGPAIDFGQNQAALLDTNYLAAPQAATPHEVLIEDFTGVKCINCPKAHKFIKIVAGQHPGLINALAIHSAQGIFTEPILGGGGHDFRLPEAIAIDQLVGTSQAWPSMAFNRLFNPQNTTTRFVSLSGWADMLSVALADTAFANLTIEQTFFDEGSRKLRIKVTTHYTSANIPASEGHNLSIALAESDIVEAQTDSESPNGSGIDTFYVHNHVLRQLVTPATGAPLPLPDHAPGRTSIREYEVTLRPDMVAANVEVVAWLHRAGGNGKVLQSATIEVRP